jgi:hypothetical protein
VSFAPVLTFLPAGDCLTTNSLLQLLTLSTISLTVLLLTSQHKQHRKHCFIIVVQLLPWNHVCLQSRYSVKAVTYLLISWSLPSNRSTCQNKFIHFFQSSLQILHLIPNLHAHRFRMLSSWSSLMLNLSSSLQCCTFWLTYVLLVKVFFYLARKLSDPKFAPLPFVLYSAVL